ncbi:hypothetical protein [Streptomyces deserti]
MSHEAEAGRLKSEADEPGGEMDPDDEWGIEPVRAERIDIRAAVTGFLGAEPLAGLSDAWHWSRIPGFDFAGALSADGRRLLQLSGRGSYDEDLAVSVLRFAREHEGGIFARNTFLGSVEGYEPPTGYAFDTVVGIAPEVHRFYRVDKPELTPHVRLVFPAYACEFSGGETLEEAVTRYQS